MNAIYQHIAIAKAVGLERLAPIQRRTRKGSPDPYGVMLWFLEESHGGSDTWSPVPRYSKDLNAMHAAECALEKDEQLWKAYRMRLEHALSYHLAFHAPADIRAEQFLRTLGLWQESSPAAGAAETLISVFPNKGHDAP